MFSITINNIESVKQAIKNSTQDVDRIINNEFKNFGLNTANDAKEKAPVNERALSLSIVAEATDLKVAVGAYIEYAPYLEFGTKKFAAEYIAGLPDEWQQFAAQFQGKGSGNFAQMLLAIKKWVMLKGIATGKDIDQAAYLIARSILINGIKAQPFLYPAFEKNKLDLIEKLKAHLNVK